ncbi:MAG: glycosyltransferase family 4 protein [Bacteroides nordii]|jgi:hypothetical protein
MKRVLVVTQYIYPENFKSNELVFELAKRGYKVDVLTGIPNYPEGVYYKGYNLFKRRIEKKDGVTFYRCLQLPRGRRASAIGLSLNYLSFVFSGILWIIFYFMWKRKYDAIITHEPSPITQLIPACLLGIIRSTSVYSWIMDIWPDSIMLSVSSKLYKRVSPILTYITEWTYKKSTRILITSKGFEKLICRNKDFHDKIVYFPNWSVDMSKIDPQYNIPNLPKGFRIMLAGNLGDGQNLESIGKCMLLLKEYKEIKWIFVGDGSRKLWLESFIEENGLTDIAFLMGRYPGGAMPSFFKKADALLATLKGGYEFLDMTVPARVQSYMSAGKPILAMLGRGSQYLIREADCGYAVDPGDYKALANVIVEKVLPNRSEFANMGRKGRWYYEKNFVLGKCIDNLETIINH